MSLDVPELAKDGLNFLNTHFRDNSYAIGYKASKADQEIFEKIEKVDSNEFPYLFRWHKHIASFADSVQKSWLEVGKVTFHEPEKEKEKEKEDDDDDVDLFGDDDDDNKEAEEAKKKILEDLNAKKKQDKSLLVLDVKPWDDETDMKEVEKLVRSITMDGLTWGKSTIEDVAFTAKKLRITAVIIDELVSVDLLEEKITGFEDLIQSMDIASFNKRELFSN
ncbi:elongation factor 1-beta [Anaeramoeba ignava]|uniref:Elongation factor 1-beta n=1 Tax=Anaeramoeba ignava TaxID=1746090 RepID=A0A9Q0R552_ANAIG|nr:elongation factor 1-beta [Anaeramoeba ignava]